MSFLGDYAWVRCCLLFCFGVAKDLWNYAELLTLSFLEGKLALYLVEDITCAQIQNEVFIPKPALQKGYYI